MVNDVGIVRRNDKRCDPLSSETRFILIHFWEDWGGALSARNPEVCAFDMPIKSRGIDDIRVCGIDGMTRTLSSWSSFKFHSRDFVSALAQIHSPSETSVILHRSIHTKGIIHVIVDVEKLADREIVCKLPPSFPSIIRDHDTSIVHVDDVVGIVGVDPQAVMVSMHPW